MGSFATKFTQYYQKQFQRKCDNDYTCETSTGEAVNFYCVDHNQPEDTAAWFDQAPVTSRRARRALTV